MPPGETASFAGHNYKNDYRYKIGLKQKADGKVQLDTLTVRSDTVDGLVDSVVNLFEDIIGAVEKKGYVMVKMRVE